MEAGQKSEFIPGGVGQLDVEGTYLERMIEGGLVWPKRDIPGWDKPIRIRPLGRGIEQQCHVEAMKWAHGQSLDTTVRISPAGERIESAGKELYEERAAQLILFQALVTHDSDPTKPDEAKPLARTFTEFINHPAMTDDTISGIWREYLDIKRRCSPDMNELSEAERGKLIAAIKKNPSRTTLERVPRPFVEDLAIFSTCLESDSTGSKSDTSKNSS